MFLSIYLGLEYLPKRPWSEAVSWRFVHSFAMLFPFPCVRQVMIAGIVGNGFLGDSKTLLRGETETSETLCLVVRLAFMIMGALACTS